MFSNALMLLKKNNALKDSWFIVRKNRDKMDDEMLFVVILNVPDALENDDAFWNEYRTLVKLHCGVYDVHGRSHVTFNSIEAARRFASAVESMRPADGSVSVEITAF